MKKIAYTLILVANAIIANSQVAKKVVVEHFTNTKCSACAARNPGFYSNYNSQSGVMHLAVHPSSPYSACVLSQHNVSENDGRTNYYGIYGGTPRLVIQGVVVSGSADYSNTSIFTPYISKLSPASIKITQIKYGNDSIRSKVVVKTMSTHTLSSLNLFVALAEDTINYTGSNGEPKHYDVFRKAYTPTSGIIINLPSTIGDSVVYTKSTTVNGAWNFSRIFTLAILQETSSKEVVQAEWAKSTNTSITGIIESNENEKNISIYTSDKIVYINQVQSSEDLKIEISDLAGRKIVTDIIKNKSATIDLNGFESGVYFYSTIFNNQQVKSGKLIIQ